MSETFEEFIDEGANVSEGFALTINNLIKSCGYKNYVMGLLSAIQSLGHGDVDDSISQVIITIKYLNSLIKNLSEELYDFSSDIMYVLRCCYELLYSTKYNENIDDAMNDFDKFLLIIRNYMYKIENIETIMLLNEIGYLFFLRNGYFHTMSKVSDYDFIFRYPIKREVFDNLMNKVKNSDE